MYLQWTAPLWLWFLLLPAAGLAIVWVRFQYLRSEPKLNPGRRRLLVGLRSAALALLFLAIMGPMFLLEESRDIPAEVAIVVDDSASMAFPAGLGSRSRWTEALEAAARIESAVSAGSGHVRTTLLRGNGIEPLRLLDAPGPGGAPEAVGSDLDGVLRQVVARWADRPLRGLVLIGDGYDTGATTTQEQGHLPPGLATFGLGTGDPVGPPDRLIRDLSYPDLAWEDDDIVVELAVSSLHVPDGDRTPVHVSLLEDGNRIAEAEAPVADGLTRLELVFSPSGTGLRVFELQVDPLVNERFRDNNTVTLAIDVRKERARVLLLAEQPGWNTRFLAQAAALEPRLDLAVAYRSTGGLVLADSLDADGRLRPWQVPGDPAQWRRWDGVIAVGGSLPGDVDAVILARAVEAGLGFFWMEGAESPDLRGVVGRAIPPADLLPIRGRQLMARPGSWQLRTSVAMGSHALLDGVDLSLLDLPPLGAVFVAERTAGAEVLLTARDMVHPEMDLPLLVVESAGAGRKAWFGGSDLWKCAFWEGPGRSSAYDEHPIRRLLRNFLVWTALGGEETGLALAGGRTVYREGERIRIEARRHDLRGRVTEGATPTVRLRGHGRDPEDDRVFSLHPVPSEPGLLATTLPPLPPGQYTLLPGDRPDPAEGRGRSLVVSAGSLEDTQLRQGRRLRGVVRSLGGRFLATADSAAAMSAADGLLQLDLDGETQTLRSRVELRSRVPLLLVFVALLGTEWYLRRRWGLL